MFRFVSLLVFFIEGMFFYSYCPFYVQLYILCTYCTYVPTVLYVHTVQIYVQMYKMHIFNSMYLVLLLLN